MIHHWNLFNEFNSKRVSELLPLLFLVLLCKTSHNLCLYSISIEYGPYITNVDRKSHVPRRLHNYGLQRVYVHPSPYAFVTRVFGPGFGVVTSLRMESDLKGHRRCTVSVSVVGLNFGRLPLYDVGTGASSKKSEDWRRVFGQTRMPDPRRVDSVG